MKRTFAATAALLVVLLALVTTYQETDGATPDSCHLREFDLCMTSALVIVQQPQGSKVSEADIDKQCKLFEETKQCINEFSEACMTPSQHHLVDFASGGFLRYMQEYCEKGSDTRKLYLKHGDCVNKQRKNANKCLLDFQAAIEKSTLDATHWKNRPKTLCCSMDRYRDCNAKIIEAACGKEAVEVGRMLIRGTFSRAAIVTCEKYKHPSAECKALLPPVGTVPKGAKSNSVLSKLMSVITQS